MKIIVNISDIDDGKWAWSDDMKTYNVIVEGNIAISNLKWKPKDGEVYYSVNFMEDSLVTDFYWYNDKYDNNLYRRGLVFKTKEEARKVAETMFNNF